MFVMFLAKDLQPHPKTFARYILRYLILNLIYSN